MTWNEQPGYIEVQNNTMPYLPYLHAEWADSVSIADPPELMVEFIDLYNLEVDWVWSNYTIGLIGSEGNWSGMVGLVSSILLKRSFFLLFE